MNRWTYKGYSARIEFDERDDLLIGHLVGLTDIVSFHADTVADLRFAFIEAVDDYLETCQKIGKTPQKGVEHQITVIEPCRKTVCELAK
ncbi:type II toxin-antitoxin system HicB family antitoxin [Chromatium okenii]|jgi:predicted HicB family RNase H-like nuclease|uniref:Toxin-antitoxin system HicB family antitoxin n=1 Tax=Chromatium okenii TaxID=61644 RepID=A0A2S7XSJ8_9GAMM|nr:type II toxin-antitoxin system HicB family antitoxin [Chromatium okenii]MBV5308394.1 type II toxin-antitoxin system HicB family antitoxin [Chromatium okenii]PQJ95840.1 toxin-antitoxin system HicB family antitoxin [Chromatium okenii]PQJ96371.1 toxin-antitoxin system HicB family antitoxin [Chromatium okenii]